jgi:hypothetical protein
MGHCNEYERGFLHQAYSTETSVWRLQNAIALYNDDWFMFWAFQLGWGAMSSPQIADEVQIYLEGQEKENGRRLVDTDISQGN